MSEQEPTVDQSMIGDPNLKSWKAKKAVPYIWSNNTVENLFGTAASPLSIVEA